MKTGIGIKNLIYFCQQPAFDSQATTINCVRICSGAPNKQSMMRKNKFLRVSVAQTLLQPKFLFAR